MIRIWKLLLISGCYFLTAESQLYAREEQNVNPVSLKSELMPVDKEANPKEWKVFHGLSPKQRENVWKYHQKKGRSLEHWHWTWRIAWIRHCSQSQKSYCSRILNQGLRDKAAVVRAETANRLGDRFANSGRTHEAVIKALSSAYKITGNNRKGTPLFVRYRILSALHKIMGSEGQELIRHLASEHKLTSEYYAKLTET